MSNIGHNSGITAPNEQEVLDDLKTRYPDIDRRLAEFQSALAEYPKELTLKDADRAAALQDLLGQITDQKSIIAGRLKTDKAPWKKALDVVTNFFKTGTEKLEALQDEWKPVHQHYMDLVRAEKVRKQEEEAERQRKKEEEARKAAEAAQREAEAAAAREAEARRKEEEARAAQAAAEAAKKKAEEEAAAAAAEEKRLAQEKKDRERAEKERNEDNLKAIRRHMKDAVKLHDAIGEAERLSEDAEQADIDQLDALIRPGGIISVLAGPVAASMLLDADQTTEINEVKAKLEGIRAALHERLDAKEKRKRAAAAKKQAEADAIAAEARRKQREEDDRKAEEARKAREKAEAEKKEAEEAARKAREEGRDAREEARGAAKDQKLAGREVKAHEVTADRAANAADKIETYLSNATDAEIAGVLRGELGTRGSLTRRWTLAIVDEDALRAVSGPAGPHFTQDALNGAAYRWMMAHLGGWSGKDRVDGNEVGLPGVTFAYQQGDRIVKS